MYTWLSLATGPIPRTDAAIALPLVHNSLPVVRSNARRTALAWPRGSPLDTAKTTPFTTTGVSHDTFGPDDHAGCSVTAPLASTILKPVTTPAAATTQRGPPASSKVDAPLRPGSGDPPPGTGGVANSGVLWSAPPSDALSSRYRRPSWLPATMKSLPLY